MRRPRRPASQLRLAIDCMPPQTKRAMLDAVQRNSIIVGGYVDGSGGVCPMLAAHRNGGRTSFASFARAWDRYTRASRKPRRATEREVRTLRTMLESSIAVDDVHGGALLGEAIAAHRRSQADRAVREEHSEVPGMGTRFSEVPQDAARGNHEIDLIRLSRELARHDVPEPALAHR